MKKLLLFCLLPMFVAAQPGQDLYISFPAGSPVLGTDTVKIWMHVPANYPSSGGGVMIGLHGLGDPNNSNDIRTYLTATSDNYNLLLVCAAPYLGQEDSVKLTKSKAVINETMDSVLAWYKTDLNNTYLCGYSAGSDVAAHYTLEDPVYPVKGLIWYAPGFYGSVLFPNIDTAYAAPIPPICLCRGTTDLVSQSSAAKIESIFSGSSVPFLKVSPAGIGHTMKYPAFTSDIATCMNFIIANSPTAISEQTSIQAQVFPNPFSGQVTFEIADNEPATVSLCNFFGQQLIAQSFTNSTTINTEQLANGIYFYELKNASGILKTGKLLKQ